MGDHNIHTQTDKDTRLQFIKHVMDDLEALDIMIQENMIEKGITRIGAEQEFCLVDKVWKPADNAVEVLASIKDKHFTTELAKYNLEINLDPRELKDQAFSEVENQLKSLLQKAKSKALEKGSHVVLTGILPSITLHELGLDFMTPNPRYYELNTMLRSLRDADFHLHLTGVDELSLTHSNIMFEACCTSFQMHLQIQPEDFISSFNWAQAIAGPVLGICANSPLLLGRELWNETRIALFRQSIDTRNVSGSLSRQHARVHFGEDWAKDSITSIFQNEVSRYKRILYKEMEKSSLEELQEGKIPKLAALSLHCGTIYPWNRPCYGVGGGIPHFRIENRYIPSGPSIIDEMANFAFWVGLMVGRPEEFDDMPKVMDFKDAKANFIKSARNGSETLMRWKGKDIPLKKLIYKELLPIAYEGLKKVHIDSKDIDTYFDVIEQRIRTQTAAKWMVSSYRNLKKTAKTDDAIRTLTKSIYTNQQSERPVHEWEIAEMGININQYANKVGHIMSNRLITADIEDAVSITLKIMEWNHIHHLPVVDHQNQLVGLLTWNHLEKHNLASQNTQAVESVEDIMETEIFTAEPSTLIEDAIALMKKEKIGCLPVVENKKLVGIITWNDLEAFVK